MPTHHAVAAFSLSVWKEKDTSGLPGLCQGNWIGPGFGERGAVLRLWVLISLPNMAKVASEGRGLMPLVPNPGGL